MATFSDDFNRADSETVGDCTEFGGGLKILSNALAPSVTGADLGAGWNKAETADHSLQVTWMGGGHLYWQISVRGNAANAMISGTCYHVEIPTIGGSGGTLYRAVGGAWTSLGSASDTGYSSGQTAFLSAVGSTVTYKRNGTTVRTATDTNVTAGTWTGAKVYSQNTTASCFDDLAIADISSGTALPARPLVINAQPRPRRRAQVTVIRSAQTPSDGSATASGSLDLSGTVAAGAGAAASGSLTMGGSASAVGAVTAPGSLTLAGSATAWGAGTAAGSLTLGGGAAAWVAPTASGSVTLSGAATGAAPVTASGSMTLAGSATAQAPVTASGALSLSGSATAAAGGANTATGSLSLDGTVTAQAPVTASGSIALSGTASAGAPATATGSLTISGTASATQTGSTASGALSLSGSASAGAPAAASGALSLSGTATVARRAGIRRPVVHVRRPAAAVEHVRRPAAAVIEVNRSTPVAIVRVG